MPIVTVPLAPFVLPVMVRRVAVGVGVVGQDVDGRRDVLDDRAIRVGLATGSSFCDAIWTVTVAVSVPPWPSLIV